MSDHHVNMVNQTEKQKWKNRCVHISHLFFLENPCIKNNPCLNDGTCFGQYSLNGTVYTQCFCPQGYTGTYCDGTMNINKSLTVLRVILFLATLCTATSCNGGLCTAAQNTIVCLCPTGKTGDRCEVRFHLFIDVFR